MRDSAVVRFQSRMRIQLAGPGSQSGGRRSYSRHIPYGKPEIVENFETFVIIPVVLEPHLDALHLCRILGVFHCNTGTLHDYLHRSINLCGVQSHGL